MHIVHMAPLTDGPRYSVCPPRAAVGIGGGSGQPRMMVTSAQRLKDRLLQFSQRLKVEALIRKSTLRVQDFRWAIARSETTRSANVARLDYVGAGAHAFFQFDRLRRQHYAFYSSGEGADEHFSGTWERQLLHVGGWLDRLASELHRTPGLRSDDVPPPPLPLPGPRSD